MNQGLFVFHTFDDLKKLAARENESWERMLACTPAVETMNIQLMWRFDINKHEYYGVAWSLTVRNLAGIAVWDVVKRITQVLKSAKEMVRLKCGHMHTITGYIEEQLLMVDHSIGKHISRDRLNFHHSWLAIDQSLDKQIIRSSVSTLKLCL